VLLADPDLARAVRSDKDLQRQMCDPTYNPHAAAFFIFNFCQTQDEERQGAIGYLPPAIWPEGTRKTPWHAPGEASWALKWVEALDAPRPCSITGRDDPHNVHDEKARRMLHTWIAMHYNLWALQWVRGYSSLLISETGDHVDDKGKQGTKVFSMFSRMRFSWERLPHHVRKHLDWTFMSGVCAENDAWTLGRAPTEDAGRGSGFVRAFVDECAYVEYMNQIHTALDPACKFGKVYMSTVNGPDNLYAEIKKMRYDGWRFFECDWKENPALTEGIRSSEPGPERERYGSHVSPKFIAITASLRDEKVAQEYGRNYDKSTGGAVLREYSKDVHVRRTGDPRGPLRYDPGLELRVGVDLGHVKKFAATVIQPVEMVHCRVIGAMEGIRRSLPENTRHLIEFLRALGFHGDLDDVVCVPDPSAFNEEIGTGLEAASWLRAAGFGNFAAPLIVGPDSVYLGNNVLRAMFQRNMFTIDEENCGPLIEAIPAYKQPTNRRTGEITSNKPIHNMASHPVDSFRYPVTSIWTADDVPYDGFISETTVRRAAEQERFRNGTAEQYTDGALREADDDEGGFFAPVFSGVRETVF
jgi:hypothetical protein